MAFRSSLKSLLCVAGSVSAVWRSNCPHGASLHPQVCMFSPSLVLAWIVSFFLVVCSVQEGFCLVWGIVLADGCRQLRICSRIVCLVLCCLILYTVKVFHAVQVSGGVKVVLAVRS